MTAADRIRRATWVLFAIGCAVMMTVQLLRVRTRLGRHDLDGRARAERLQRTQPPTGRIAHAALSMPRIAAPTAQPVCVLSYPSAVHRHDCCLSYRSCCQANSSRRLQSQPLTPPAPPTALSRFLVCGGRQALHEGLQTSAPCVCCTSAARPTPISRSRRRWTTCRTFCISFARACRSRAHHPPRPAVLAALMPRRPRAMRSVEGSPR